MAKVALELEQALSKRDVEGAPGSATSRAIAHGDGWSVADVICTSSRADRSFEEQHAAVCVAIVAAGVFQYRSPAGLDLMTPGSLLLGSPGQCFECGHDHSRGDQCLSFWFTPDYFERITGRGEETAFNTGRIPPLRGTSRAVASACAAVVNDRVDVLRWEEIGIRIAAAAADLSECSRVLMEEASSDTVGRVVDVIHDIDAAPDRELSIADLSDRACLSPFHFLRTFERVTGVTPHQYVLRSRLRYAALRLVDEPSRVIDIALDSGFGDISNFNRAFRAEFGVSPREYRKHG